MQMSNLLWCMAQAELTGENDRWCSGSGQSTLDQGWKGKRDGITEVEKERERERVETDDRERGEGERGELERVYSELPWTKLDLLHDGSTATLQFRMLISQPALRSPSLSLVSTTHDIYIYIHKCIHPLIPRQFWSCGPPLTETQHRYVYRSRRPVSFPFRDSSSSSSCSTTMEERWKERCKIGGGG